MRLTLRTLLAYLDNTLDPKDAEAIRDKLGESGFATQLVQRIRGTLDDAKLSAPPPNAVNPVAEANVISEYLDSTLSAEQVAEIEKACLESDTHLAEAAACHQILTMVLGQPAEVPSDLRERVYALPDRKVEEKPTPASGSFSSVAVPEPGTLTGMPEESSESVLTPSAEKVEPVGVADSGVRDAPARLRDSGTLDDPDLVDPRRVGAADMKSGSFNFARLTPWLVSAAMACILIFTLTKIFSSLLTDPVAQNSNTQNTVGDVNSLDDPSDTEPSESDDDSADDPDVSDDADSSNELTDSEATDSDADSDAAKSNAASESFEDDPAEKDTTGDSSSPEEKVVPSPEMKSNSETVENDNSTTPETDDGTTSKANTESTDPKETEPDSGNVPTPVEVAKDPSPKKADDPDASKSDPAAIDSDPNMVAENGNPTENDNPTKTAVSDDTPPTADDLKDPAAAAVDQGALAQHVSEGTLVVARTKDEQWVPIAKDMMVNQLATVMSVPKFQTSFEIDDKAAVTLVGATQAKFLPPGAAENTAGIHVLFGRALLKTQNVDLVMPVNAAGNDVILDMPDENTQIIIEVIHLRRPGFDPFTPKNHVPIARIAVIKGELVLKSSTGDETLAAGKQWMVRGDDPPKVIEIPEVPDWADPKKRDDSVLDESAREGLLALLQQPPYAASLRAACDFRKSEVASLAAQTLLEQGESDVYFGSDGILSRSKQRAYFSDHFRALRAVVNRDAESARRLRDEIAKMDSANGESIFRLLIGFSQNQLVEGADEELIELLDSDAMAVRVLAIENLREITGTTLNFRPEEDNAVRRVPAIKKWQVRYRKGDIRWSAGGK